MQQSSFLDRFSSVNATQPAATVSEKYKFISTRDAVNGLMENGWKPINVKQANSHKPEFDGKTKHQIRFRRGEDENTRMKVGDSVFELVLTNSHNGASQFELSAGVYRLVCSNGLTVPDSVLERIKVRHSGKAVEDVVDASFRVIEELPQVTESVNSMRSIVLSRPERVLLAESALTLKYDPGTEEEPKAAPISPAMLLEPRRLADQDTSLWTTLNVIQENLVRGGQVYFNGNRRQRTREIKGVSQDQRLNRALWELAEGMKALKGG